MSSIKSTFPRSIFLGAATRTPIGKFGGSLLRFSASELATFALRECIKRSPEIADKAPAEFVILGHARQAGAGPNPARQAGVAAGLPETVPAFTVNQACASGIISIINAVEKIALGRTHSIFAGGTESMSNTPYFLPQVRWGQRLGNSEVIDGMKKDGFFCPMSQLLMGETVEKYLAQELGISRSDQDEYALRSQTLAAEAWEKGLFNAETFEIPANPKNPQKQPGLKKDEHLNSGTTREGLAKLSPVFDTKAGSITAGNSSGITDGAAFIHVSDQKFSHSQVEILDFEIVGLDPRRMGLGPVPATLNLLTRNRLTVNDLDSVELNEAFAAQVLACQRELKIPIERLNARGGAIALGHPIGATGTRIITTLIHRLQGKPNALGLATLCVSGGHGVAVLVRSIS